MSEPDTVAALTHVTDHVAGGKALLTTMFRKPLIQALLASWLTQVQAVEDAIWQLFGAFDLDTATGDQLVKLGALIGLSSDGLSDDLYRLALRAWVRASRSRGLDADMHAILEDAIDGAGYDLTNWAPANVVATTVVPVEIGDDLLARILRRATADGVGVQLVAPVDDSSTFAFSTDSETSTTNSTRGWADASQTTGGHLVGAWE